MSETTRDPVSRERRPVSGRGGIRLGALLAVGLAAAFVTWLLAGRGDDEAATIAGPVVTLPGPVGITAPAAVALTPSVVTVAELGRLAAVSELPVHWAGPRAGKSIEASSHTDGSFFVRYLARGVDAGADRPSLTIATYPRPNAFAEVQRVAADGTARLTLAGGGVAVYDPTNVHLAYPGRPYQVEVFSPVEGAARALVASGAIRPVP